MCKSNYLFWWYYLELNDYLENNEQEQIKTFIEIISFLQITFNLNFYLRPLFSLKLFCFSNTMIFVCLKLTSNYGRILYLFKIAHKTPSCLKKSNEFSWSICLLVFGTKNYSRKQLKNINGFGKIPF